MYARLPVHNYCYVVTKKNTIGATDTDDDFRRRFATDRVDDRSIVARVRRPLMGLCCLTLGRARDTATHTPTVSSRVHALRLSGKPGRRRRGVPISNNG